MRMTSKQYKATLNYLLGSDRSTDLKQEADTFYFTMCLLLPEQSFMEIVDKFGGLACVLESVPLQKFIATVFKVDYKLVYARAKLLYKEQKKMKQKENAKVKTMMFLK